MLLSLGSPSQHIGLGFFVVFQVSASVVFPRAACLKCIGPFLFLVSLDAPFPFFLRPFYVKGMQKTTGRIVELLPCLMVPKLMGIFLVYMYCKGGPNSKVVMFLLKVASMERNPSFYECSSFLGLFLQKKRGNTLLEKNSYNAL